MDGLVFTTRGARIEREEAYGVNLGGGNRKTVHVPHTVPV